MNSKRSDSFKYLFLLFFTSSTAFASVAIDTRIHDVIAPTQSGEATRVLSTADGYVYEVEGARTELMARIRQAQKTQSPLHLIVEGDRVVDARALRQEEAR